MKTITEGRRGCGVRKEGATYLVSEPGGGELPLWNPIEPPIPYDDEHFRGWVEIDLEATLDDRKVVLSGTSAEREREEDAKAWEIKEFGMPLQTRLRIGIGKGLSEEELAIKLGWLSMARLGSGGAVDTIGSCLRALGEMQITRLDAELAKVWHAAQDDDPAAILASSWRMARLLPAGKVRDAKRHLMRIMVLVGALHDALFLRDRYYDQNIG